MGLWKSYKDMVSSTAVSIAEKQDKINIQLQVIAGNHFIPTGKVTIINGAKPKELTFKISWTNTKTAIVRSIEWQSKKERSATGAVIGAVAGAVVTGGIGAIAGAVIGGRSKDESIAIIGLEDGQGQVSEIHVNCTGKEYEMLQRVIRYEESDSVKMIKNVLNR